MVSGFLTPGLLSLRSSWMQPSVYGNSEAKPVAASLVRCSLCLSLDCFFHFSLSPFLFFMP